MQIHGMLLYAIMNQQRAISGLSTMFEWFEKNCTSHRANSFVLPNEGGDFFTMATLREALTLQNWKQRKNPQQQVSYCTPHVDGRYVWTHESEWITAGKKKIRVYAHKKGDMLHGVHNSRGRFSITLVNASHPFAVGPSREFKWCTEKTFCIPCAALCGLAVQEERDNVFQGCVRLQKSPILFRK